MAAFLACKRVSNSGIGLIRGFRASKLASTSDGANSKRLLLVDTLAVVRELEGQGVPSKQAEVISNVLKDTLENIFHLTASKGEMHKVESILEANLSKFMSEVEKFMVEGKSSQELLRSEMNTKIDKFMLEGKSSQELLRSEMNTKIEKLDTKIDKFMLEGKSSQDLLRSEMNTKIEKLDTKIDDVAKKLDTKIDDVAKKLDTKIDEVAKKIDTNMDKLVANVAVQVANARHDVLKYVIGAVLSIIATGAAVVGRIEFGR